jgi:hypothetical protein
MSVSHIIIVRERESETISLTRANMQQKQISERMDTVEEKKGSRQKGTENKKKTR